MTDIITTEDLLACVRRELTVRRNVYPSWVLKRKMSAGTAAHEIACMTAIVADYEARTTEKKDD